jgi:hypothetical protein
VPGDSPGDRNHPTVDEIAVHLTQLSATHIGRHVHADH